MNALDRVLARDAEFIERHGKPAMSAAGTPYAGKHLFRVWFRTLAGWDWTEVRADTPEEAAKSQRRFKDGWNALAKNVEMIAPNVIAVAACALISVLVATFATADELVPPAEAKILDAMVRVETTLVVKGFPKAAGFSHTPAPRVVFFDQLPNNDWGSYDIDNRGYIIKVSRAQPEGCAPITIAHELAHIATITNHLIPPDAPGDARTIKARFQAIAASIEDPASIDGEWLPNCLIRRGHK